MTERLIYEELLDVAVLSESAPVESVDSYSEVLCESDAIVRKVRLLAARHDAVAACPSVNAFPENWRSRTFALVQGE